MKQARRLFFKNNWTLNLKKRVYAKEANKLFLDKIKIYKNKDNFYDSWW